MIIAQSIQLIGQQLSIYLIVQARISALLASLFFFRKEFIPSRILVAISILLTVYIISSSPAIDSKIYDVNSSLFLALCMQIFLGFITGLVVNFIAEIFLGFGQIISVQSGLGFVSLFIPKIGTITPLSQFFVITVSLIFFELNGHLILFKMIIDSFLIGFTNVPKLNWSIIPKILDFSKIIFTGSLLLSMAVIIALMLTNFTIAILTKFSPQLNIFSIGINISLIICFFSVYLGFDLIVENGNILFNDIFNFIKQIKL